MQDRGVGGIDATFESLKPVAFLDHFRHMAVRRRHLRPLELRQRRHVLARPHIGPDDPTQFDGGVGCGANFMGETAIRRLVHLLDTGAGHVELPAVIDTAQTRLLIAAEPERDPTVWAELIQQADSPLSISKRHQFLSQ
jgi:hypothetical protein